MRQHINNRPELGFTLVELMAVVAIIAVLSTVGWLAYINFVKNARDTKRISDIDTIANSIESSYEGSRNPSYLYNETRFRLDFPDYTPSDPQGETDYCIGVNNTPVAILVPNGQVLSNWNSGCIQFPQANQKISITKTDGLSEDFEAGVDSWLLCAKLEKGQAYCKSNQQN
jgi:prepilin-type N-terminal cleavage/methylation domain-containing protein